MASSSQSQEFVVRAPKNSKMTYGIVKFNPSNKVDFTTAESVKIERENNLKDYKAAYDMDVLPKFGAGSEFGREEREEARRKKYGINRRKYNVEDQPWLLKLGTGKAARKFKGTKEGGILENASYYIFTQCADGAFDAFPVKDWHSFNPVIKYKHLNIDEAEEEYNRRDKTLNYFNIMVKKRVKGPDAEEREKEEEEEKQNSKKKKKGKDFLLTDMDDWAILSEDENDDSDDEKRRQSDSDDDTRGKKKDRRKIKKDYKTNSGDEAVEESDDADEGREVDYMTDTDSDDDEMYEEGGRDKLDKYKQTGVEDEEGLQKIIESGDEEEEEAEKEESAEEGSDKEGSQSSSGSSSESESDLEKDSTVVSALLMQKKDPLFEKKEREKKEKEKKKKKDKKDKDKKGKNGRKRRNSESSEASNLTNSRSATPTISSQNEKKEESHVAKRAKMETPPVSGTEGLTEDMVRRYLIRKPMTTGDLVKKLKKNVGLSKDKLVISITEILKKLNPEKKTIDGKLHLWIKKTE